MNRNRRDALEARLNEVQLRQKMVDAGKKQGVWIKSVNDRFMSGRPDMRLKASGVPHLDVELKICRLSHRSVLLNQECKTGLSKLQHIEIRDMNAAGVPSVASLYWSDRDIFTFTTSLTFNAGDAIKDVEFQVPGENGKPDMHLFAAKAYEWLIREGYQY